MHYVGDTDGNLNRVAKDMTYLIRRFGGGEDTTAFEQISGILDQQVTRMKKSLRIMEEQNLEVDEFTKRLRRLSVRSVLKDFDLFRGIVSLPKPTFMMGLDESSNTFIEHRLEELDLKETPFVPDVQVPPLGGPLRVSELTITYLSHVRRTLATHAIQQAFDISPTDIRTAAIHKLNFELNPGDVMLIEGPSGSGKTTLLEAILGNVDTNKAEVDGLIEMPEGFLPSAFQPLRSRKSLIELFADGGVREGLHFLGLAGLSEPFLYLKRFEELSKGQQYRAMLAQVLASGQNVWIADEFCANLDEITANLVAYNIQRIARQQGLTVIVAASNPRPFVLSLNPDTVVRLSSSSQSSVLTGTEYIKALKVKTRQDDELQQLTVSPDFLFTGNNGRELTAIHKGRESFREELLMLSCGEHNELVRVTRCTRKRFGNLSEDDVPVNGYSDVEQLRGRLKAADATLTDRSVVTIVGFVPLSGELINGD